MIFNLINTLRYFAGYFVCVYCGAAQSTLLPILFTFGAYIGEMYVKISVV